MPDYAEISRNRPRKISVKCTKTLKIVILRNFAEATYFAEGCLFHGLRRGHVIAE